MVFKNKSQKNRGSLMFGSVLVLLIISVISVAIITRTFQGALLASDTRKGYVTYQNVDQNTEKVLNQLKKIDNSDASLDPKLIPENIDAYTNIWGGDYCGDGLTKCINIKGDPPSTTRPTPYSPTLTARVNSLAYMKGIEKTVKSVNGLERSISVPFPERISSGLNKSNLKVKQCGKDGLACPDSGNSSGKSYNKCDLEITLTNPSAAAVTDKIKGYEFRRSISAQLGDLNYGWRFVGSADSAAGEMKMYLKNGDANILNGNDGTKTDGTGQYNRKYSFTVKAKNKNPLSLDSAYLSDGNSTDPKSEVAITLGNTPQCSNATLTGLSGLKCAKRGSPGNVGYQPIGTRVAEWENSCCNGTECFEPDPNWKPDDPHMCALQKCGANEDGWRDSVASNIPNGDGGKMSGIGWCGSSATCVDGASCTYPYRTIGYCTAQAAPSTQSATFLPSTSWTLSNYVDVDRNDVDTPTTDIITNSKPRCSYHNCPSSAINGCGSPTGGGGSYSVSGPFGCSQATCGPYTNVSVSCTLSCNTGYYRAETKASASVGENVTASYDYNCCYKRCPSDTRTKDCQSGSCSERCGAYTDTRTEWDKLNCTTPAPTCTCGYASGPTCIKDCYSPSWSYTCNQDPSCGPGPSCSYGVSGSCTDNGCTITDNRACCSSSVVTTACCGVDQGCGYNECGVEVGRWADATNC